MAWQAALVPYSQDGGAQLLAYVLRRTTRTSLPGAGGGAVWFEGLALNTTVDGRAFNATAELRN